MKKSMTVIVLVLCMILLASCGQNVESEISRLDELKTQYDQVGRQHNEQLDQMLSVYRSQTDRQNRVQCMKLADTYFENADNTAKNIMNALGLSNRLSKPMSNSDVVTALADSIEIYARYPDVFDTMSGILDSELNAEAKTEKLEELYLLIDEKAENDEDKESLMNGLSTTMYSVMYWDENFDEWQDALNPTMGKAALGIAGAIAIVDGAGAVIGTLEGIRDTYKGQEGRGRIILGRAIGEAAKTSTYAVIGMILL